MQSLEMQCKVTNDRASEIKTHRTSVKQRHEIYSKSHGQIEHVTRYRASSEIERMSRDAVQSHGKYSK